MSENGKIYFNQPNQHVTTQTNIAEVAGNVVIGAQTSGADMKQAIASLRTNIAGLPGLPVDIRAQLDAALDAAAGATPSPQNAQIKSQLDSAGKALSGVAADLDEAEGVAEKAIKLAKTIYKIGTWVIAAAI